MTGWSVKEKLCYGHLMGVRIEIICNNYRPSLVKEIFTSSTLWADQDLIRTLRISCVHCVCNWRVGSLIPQKEMWGATPGQRLGQ